MTLAPRAVVIHRRTELDELLARHGTRGQVAFFLHSRGREIEEVEARHQAVQRALATVSAGTPLEWRRGHVERNDLPRFLFAPEDVVVVVGQDGLVANVAKYLDGQPVIGINPEPHRNPGVLVPHAPEVISDLLSVSAGSEVSEWLETLSMVEARAEGQRLCALNEIFVGHPSHQTARYRLTAATGRSEHQASSGLIVSTGTGATGWTRSIWQQRRSTVALPAPSEPRLAWFVREAWPSPATGTSMTEGILAEDTLVVSAESERLVAFGDGIETDSLSLTWGQSVELRLAEQTLSLLR